LGLVLFMHRESVEPFSAATPDSQSGRADPSAIEKRLCAALAWERQAINCRALKYRWNPDGAAADDSNDVSRPRFTAFAHASLFCKDLEQAKRFFTKVLGGQLVHDVDGFAEVRVAGVIIGLTVRPGTVTGRHAEYPHYAFFIEAEDFLPMVAWLRRNRVIASEPWTRDGVKGLLYFRDPSGNLFEVYCRNLDAAAGFARGAKQGGSTRSILPR
jgi:catechol 2,3-dioxygenase-like lactoylglutathione lyase family enzyme